MSPDLVKILSFLDEVGIEYELTPLPGESFLPGISIGNGRLLIDVAQLKHPGDVLHEAGHIAVELPEDRPKLSGNVEEHKPNAAKLEIGVILWTWAAIVYLDLDPAIVFHEEGYRGASTWYIEQFSQGNYIGLPLLKWMGLTGGPQSLEPFPHMTQWLRPAPEESLS